SYDSRGRLQTVTFQNGTTVTYSYDATGNRTSVVTTCPGGTC
ncbi:MAG: RHS repeat protein, partial [Microbacteriaceae bacterium]|nr:RHS repeat protein [Microbacteriaceae bacterium]